MSGQLEPGVLAARRAVRYAAMSLVFSAIAFGALLWRVLL